MKLDVKLILLFFGKAMCSLVYPTNKMCSYSNLMFHINYYTKYFVNQKYGNILINLSHLNFSDNLLSDSDLYFFIFLSSYIFDFYRASVKIQTTRDLKHP